MTHHQFHWSVDPECVLGYSTAQLRERFGDQYPAFEAYMLMKAAPKCTGPRDAVPSIGHECSCATTHSQVFYVHDVIRFVEHA